MTAHMVEDESFAYGGYWKGTVADLIDGDGFRLNAVTPCLLVEHTELDGDNVMLFHSDRSVHVAQVFADAFHRPFEHMNDDPGLGVVTLPATTPVWIRL